MLKLKHLIGKRHLIAKPWFKRAYYASETEPHPHENLRQSVKYNFRTLSRIPEEVKTKYETECKKLEQTKGVVKAFFGYNSNDTDEIVIHCVTENESIRAKMELDLKVKYRTIDEHNEEDVYMVDKEREYKHTPTPGEYKTITFAERDTLMKKHSNLLDVYVGSCKSVGFGTDDHRIVEKPCIVFLVQCKGVIPLGEEPLPTEIDGYPTDVREAYFYRKRAKMPDDFHPKIKLGCEIGTLIGKELVSGTIGLFVDSREGVLNGVTCAHVLLNDSEAEKLKESPDNFPKGRVCSQPQPKTGEDYRCGELFCVKYTEDLDVAFFEIDASRNPDKGYFPYYETFNDAIPSNLHFSSGETLEPGDIKDHMTVFKYGKTTKMTTGEIRGTDITTIIGTHKMTKLFGVIRGSNKPFSEEGDSGSLIFTLGQGKDTKGVGILVGGNNARDYAMPLYVILRSFGNCTPTKFPSEEDESNNERKRN